MLPVTQTLAPTISRFFDDDWNNLFDWQNRNYSSDMSTLPAVNIIETADAFHVEMAAPGLKKDDFKVELNNNQLTIHSESKKEDKQMDGQFKRKEFTYSGFTRTFNLNNQVVDDSKIKASYENGILRLVLAKKEEAKIKPPRLIKIA